MVKMSIDEGSNEMSNEVFWKNLVVRYWPLVLVFGLLIIIWSTHNRCYHRFYPNVGLVRDNFSDRWIWYVDF
jgi:hypothetical protein